MIKPEDIGMLRMRQIELLAKSNVEELTIEELVMLRGLTETLDDFDDGQASCFEHEELKCERQDHYAARVVVIVKSCSESAAEQEIHRILKQCDFLRTYQKCPVRVPTMQSHVEFLHHAMEGRVQGIPIRFVGEARVEDLKKLN